MVQLTYKIWTFVFICSVAAFAFSATGAQSLRRSAAAEIPDVKFLAEFLVGDKDVATTEEDGLYAVDFNSIRTAMLPFQRQGELDGIPVEKLCLYGASPDTLSDVAPGAAGRIPAHIFEVPIEVRDHSKGSSTPNGIFDDGDTIFFVGYGTSFWKRISQEVPGYSDGKMDYYHSTSPYSFYQHFQFGYKNSGAVARLSQKVKSPAGSGKSVEWMHYVRAEKDLILRDSYFEKGLDWESGTGKEWFWIWHSRLETSTLTGATLNMPQTISLPGRIDGGREYVGVTFFPYRSVHTSSAEKENDQRVILDLSAKSYEERMDGVQFDLTVNGKKWERSKAKLIPGNTFFFEKVGLKSERNDYSITLLPNDYQYDRFDGYTVAYQWNPVVESAEWLLPGKVSGVIQVPVPAGTSVMKFVNLKPSGLLIAQNGVAKDSVSAEDDVRYLAYKLNSPKTLVKVESHPIQPSGVLSNLSKINSKTKYLIIAPDEFLDAAVSLGQFRSDGSAVMKIPTTVVSVNDIYRNYTGGTLSPSAIRNYIAYARSVCPDLKWVLLAGSGHYDYRGTNSKLGKINIPPYERESSVTEDFYAALDSGEFVRYGNYDLDVAVGRLPVSTTVEFANYIEKAKQYEKLGSFDHSEWRSTLLLAADDARNGIVIDHSLHTTYQEGIAGVIDSLSDTQGARWHARKIYLIDYDWDAAGQKKDAVEDFLNILNQGALLTTYFGHGSMTDWASEGLLKASYLSKLNNKGRYTILGSFSCTVARFDKGDARSLSEDFVLASNSGSIASVGAMRDTYASFNLGFGKAFVLNLLKKPGITIGEAFVVAKKQREPGYSDQRYNDEHYVLIGEPVIQMPATSLKVSMDEKLDTIKALDKMRITGTVRGISKGYVNLSLREGRYSKRLYLGLDDIEEDSIDVAFEGPLLYSEEVPVVGGRFETEFITPRKIAFGDTAAELTAWAYSADNPAVGRYLQKHIAIAGVSAYADSIHDNTPPAVQIQTCYGGGVPTGFSDGQIVKLQSPACLQIVVEDSTAIDYREEADEGISFEVVGVENPFHPWPYIEQNSKRAVARMTFAAASYPEGKYLFKVRAHDVLGNETVKTVNVEITGEMKAGLADVFNIPNPMGKKGTTFYFKNLAVDRTSSVDIFIYNQNGRLVKVIKNAVSGVTHWDGRDNFGRLLANGLYHYVVRSRVAATEDFKKKTWTKKQKLLISR